MRPVLLTALAVSGAATLAAQQRAISDSDLFAFRWVASPQISPDGKTIAFTSTTTPEDLAKKGKSEEPKSDVRIITQAEFRGDDEGYFDPAEHTHIWTVPAGMPGDEPATARQVTSGPFDENAPQWSRDGARIYFVSDRVAESYYYPPDN